MRFGPGDGTLTYFHSDTRIAPAPGFPNPHLLQVDGEVLIITPVLATPLTVQSRLLTLTVEGNSALRLTAYSRERGEEVAVLYGHLVARKSYPSSQADPDSLTGGEMSMVNKDIDLMEKEKCDLKELRTWADAIRRAATTSLHR